MFSWIGMVISEKAVVHLPMCSGVFLHQLDMILIMYAWMCFVENGTCFILFQSFLKNSTFKNFFLVALILFFLNYLLMI